MSTFASEDCAWATIHSKRWFPVLFIMCPHSDYFDGLDVVENLVDETMLNIDPSGTRSRKVTDELFIGWWGLIGIFGQNFEELLCLRL